MRGGVTVVELLGFAATMVALVQLARRARPEIWSAEAWHLERREWWRRAFWGLPRPLRRWRERWASYAWEAATTVVLGIVFFWFLSLVHRLIWGPSI